MKKIKGKNFRFQKDDLIVLGSCELDTFIYEFANKFVKHKEYKAAFFNLEKEQQRMFDNELKKAIKTNIYLDRKKAIDVDYIYSKCKDKDYATIFIEYNNVLDAEFAQRIKELAIKLEAPVILFVQTDKRKTELTLEDVPDTELVKYADTILLISRGLDKYLLKNKYGKTGIIDFEFLTN